MSWDSVIMSDKASSPLLLHLLVNPAEAHVCPEKERHTCDKFDWIDFA